MLKLSRFSRYKKNIDSLMIILLLSLFAITGSIVILTGVKQYQKIASQINSNFNIRTANSYIAQKISTYDYSDGIEITTLSDGTTDEMITALALNSNDNNTLYITYIYYYNGWLRELVVNENSLFSLEAGQKISQISSMDISLDTNNILSISFVDISKNKHLVKIHLQAAKPHQTVIKQYRQ